MGTQKNSLNEIVLLSTQNIWLHDRYGNRLTYMLKMLFISTFESLLSDLIVLCLLTNFKDKFFIVGRSLFSLEKQRVYITWKTANWDKFI